MAFNIFAYLFNGLAFALCTWSYMTTHQNDRRNRIFYGIVSIGNFIAMIVHVAGWL